MSVRVHTSHEMQMHAGCVCVCVDVCTGTGKLWVGSKSFVWGNEWEEGGG